MSTKRQVFYKGKPEGKTWDLNNFVCATYIDDLYTYYEIKGINPNYALKNSKVREDMWREDLNKKKEEADAKRKEQQKEYERRQDEFYEKLRKEYENSNQDILDELKLTSKKEVMEWLRKHHSDKTGNNDEHDLVSAVLIAKTKRGGRGREIV